MCVLIRSFKNIVDLVCRSVERTFKNIKGNETYYGTSTALNFNLFLQINKIFSVLEFNKQYYSGGRLTFGYAF